MMDFFTNLIKELLSPRALKGFIVGLFIGLALVVVHNIFLHRLLGDPNSTLAAYLIGAFLVALYGYWFASKTQNNRLFALGFFFIIGLFGVYLVRLVFEGFGFDSASLAKNVISYGVGGGVTCALAAGFFEAISQSE